MRQGTVIGGCRRGSCADVGVRRVRMLAVVRTTMGWDRGLVPSKGRGWETRASQKASMGAAGELEEES